MSPPSNEEVNGKYSVAIGPKLMNPKFPDDGLLNKDDFKAFDKNIELLLRERGTNKTKTIQCHVCDWKAHTYNKYPDKRYQKVKRNRNPHNINSNEIVSTTVESGFYQTGIRYPYADNSGFEINHVDGSIIEFYPNYSKLENGEGIKLNQYELAEVKVRFKSEEN